jgi:2-haloacid dehalogenase
MAKNAGLPWDCVLSGELIHKYKPDPEVYRMAARLLGYELAEVMMVAAHPPDLDAAQRAGLKTAYVPRPLEHGAERRGNPGDGHFDIVATDFLDLAAKLGA